MQENHSFDNYFGTYPTANGSISDSIVSQLQPVNGIPEHVCLPIGTSCVSPKLADGTSPSNPDEGQINYEKDYGNGSASGFPSHSGPQSMAYFDYHQIPAYWDYAEEYGLADNYFSSVLSTTTPNRLMLLAGDTPVSFNYGPPPYVPSERTILGQLSANGISWGYFDFLPYVVNNDSIPYPLNYISGLDGVSRNGIQNVSRFIENLSQGSGLPAVNFVMSLRAHLDEHPPNSVTAGQSWVVSVVNAVMRSDYWNSTAIFITWDEGGGFYDHVVPPHVFTLGLGLRSILEGYGQRVPLLVISPFSKENYVSRTLLNHLSMTKFIEYNWNLPPLTQKVADSNNLLEFFDFSAVPRKPIILGSTGPFSATSYPIPLQIPLGQLTYSRAGSWSAAFSHWELPTIAFVAAGVVIVVATALFVISNRNRRRQSG
jgi:phospholipase C